MNGLIIQHLVASSGGDHLSTTGQCSIITYALNTSWAPGKINQWSTIVPHSNLFWAVGLMSYQYSHWIQFEARVGVDGLIIQPLGSRVDVLSKFTHLKTVGQLLYYACLYRPLCVHTNVADQHLLWLF